MQKIIAVTAFSATGMAVKFDFLKKLMAAAEEAQAAEGPAHVNRYFIAEKKGRWVQGEDICANEDGIFASIHSPQDQADVEAIGGGDAKTWFGLNDREIENKWMFTDGSALDEYENWYKGEPNNWKNYEDCVMLGRDGFGPQWNDSNCDETMRILCMMPQEEVEVEETVETCDCDEEAPAK